MAVNSYMRWRVILGLSLVANLLLALGWFWSARNGSSALALAPGTTNTLTSTNTRTAVLVRRQFFSWQELESQDYQTYIKNLREIGCPEQTIRDIIIADVTEMLRGKYFSRSPQARPNPKWWTNHRDATDQDDSSDASKMWVERSAVLEQLLGSNWAVRAKVELPQTNSYQNLILATIETNPLLQGLAADKKQAVAALIAQQPANDLDQNAERADVQKAAALEKDRWAKLSQILTIDQLEAAKLHFSMQAEDLRNELDMLPGFNTQPDEFKKIFRSTEAIDAQLFALPDGDDAQTQQLRAKLFAEREAAIRVALTPERYEQYARLQDPAYLNALDQLANGKGNSTALGLLYAINRERAMEQERIENDPTLTDTQKEIELKKLELEQMKATALAQGEELIDEPGQTEKPKPEPAKVHSVLNGESLDRLARIYGVSPDALKAANPTVDFSKLSAGTSISVPLRLIYPLPPPPEPVR